MIGPAPELIDTLNDELLAATAPPPQPEEKETKRNTKRELIEKILKTAESNGVTIEQSDTKLKRMSKTQLNQLLAKVVEDAMRNQMADQVGAKRGASERVIALGALRMVHNMVATGAEKGLNTVLPKYGYEVDGFAAALNQDPVREAVDQCLEEIAAETDVLQYIESPYARLGLAWGGALIGTVRAKRREEYPTRRKRNYAKESVLE